MKKGRRNEYVVWREKPDVPFQGSEHLQGRLRVHFDAKIFFFFDVELYEKKKN